jgi:hypothetical protein
LEAETIFYCLNTPAQETGCRGELGVGECVIFEVSGGWKRGWVIEEIDDGILKSSMENLKRMFG